MHRLDCAVFVYRHKQTKEITALYIDDARAMGDREDFEHVATLEPRLFIQYHYDTIEKMKETYETVPGEV